ncbi:MAG: aa3-type cytochrome c oxidase assembly system heme A insertase Surf1 [Oceanicaulis sp. HLUCCA04]|nr:MAG: aa3-type cytochrome c oxidase assembly system heme A insertase Surf1 [Oceanicaulis sp. HLUCCA04]
MHFRPMPLLTLLTLAALAFLLTLGVWQVQRMAWKEAELDCWREASASPARDLDEALCVDTPFEGRSVGYLPEERSGNVRVYGRSLENNAPGWRIFVPVDAPGCIESGFMLAEAAFQPLGDADETLIMVERWRIEVPPAPGAFTPDPLPEERTFYAFDGPGMAAALGLDDGAVSSSWWLAQDTGEPPAYLTATPPERHFGYALTWFGMAVALLAVYLVFHAARGRLSFTGRKE